MSRLIDRDSEEWPARLDELGSNASVERLHVLGRKLDLDAPAIAVVGTRRPTGVGMETARRLAMGLAEAGVVVVSGLAVGIDAAAHRAALDAGGTTVAVLGCGLDVCYPYRNRALKDLIAAGGTIVTEHPAGTQPLKHHFPQRNRIIAALSDGVVVVEGAMTSGALVTARLALDCDRNVYATPGSVRNPMAQGPNELIRSGHAALITEVAHIFEDLAPAVAWDRCRDRPGEPSLVTDASEASVLEHLDDSSIPPDQLSAELGIKPGKLAATLSLLEVRGLVARGRGGYALTATGARARLKSGPADTADRP